MKVHQVISETNDLDEAPMGFLKKAGTAAMRYLGSQTAAGAEKTGDEANALKKQLKQHMGAIGIPKGQLTVDQLEDFLNKAGYGGMAAAELEKLRAAKQQKSDARAQKIQRFGQKVGAGISAAKAGMQAAKSTYAQRSPQESMFEADQSAPLTNAEVDAVLMAVVKQAYAKNAPVKKGKFAAPSAEPSKDKTAKKAKPKIPADIVSIMQKLSPEDQQKLMQAITKKAG